MPELQELGEFLNESLTLPVGRRKYVVPAATGRAWLQLQELAAAMDLDEANKMRTTDLYKLALGPVFDQLIEHDQPGNVITQCGNTAFYWQLGRDDLATMFWESGGNPSPRPTRAKAMTPTAAGTTTRRRASGSGTSTRKR